MPNLNDRLILCYHAVSETWSRPLSVAPERFESQVKLLAERGYSGRTFSEAATAPAGSERIVAITFDDGYRSVFAHAKPILDRYGMPATVFVPSALVGSERAMSWPGIEDWATATDRVELVPMGWDELRALAAGGWEVGSHGRSHPRLTSLGDRELREELTGSKGDIERELGVQCRSVAYPFGAFDDEAVAAAAAAGYQAGGTLAWGMPYPDAPLACPRVGIYHGDDSNRFRLKVSSATRRLMASPLGKMLAAGRG